MIPELRKQFNKQWTPALYAQFLERLDRKVGKHVEFRCSETPVFLPPPLVEKMIRYGRELYAQLASNPAYKAASEAAIPPEFRAPNETEHPLFVQADFGLIRGANGNLEPRLVEIQGFASIYGFQHLLAKTYREIYGLPENLTAYVEGLTETGYIDLLRRAILNSHSPEEVVLLDIDPYEQKTSPDFLVTQQLIGMRIGSITDVRKRGRKLYLDDVEIKRIYNRVIVDELVRKNIQPDFDFRDDLDVEWGGHPNWFFRLSKFSLPWFRHESIPETRFLSDIAELPRDLDQYVLKPLYSFAGLGVKIGPSEDDIRQIPETERGNFILQRKVDFVPTIETPSGMTKVEIRIMYIWDQDLRAVTTVLRTGRGKMMGVDFNKDLDWVGASAGFLPTT